MKIFNTLSGREEEFVPGGDTVLMYVCGITPYADSHIGHAMSYIIFDVIRRYLRFRGHKVKYVQNFTDIDDKIIDRANRLGIGAGELTARFIGQYFLDMDALNIERADVYPRATEEVPNIIELVQGLIDKGFAYPTSEGVYFRVKKDPDYGKLSHQSTDSLQSGARVEPDTEKETPLDFALWKATKPGEPSWPSPWGPGRPGWHIECSAMSLQYLGPSIDIHGGGQDLIFPHHENEIAQTECYTGVKPFVRYWMHNGLLRLGEEKMSKTLGNLVTVSQVLDRVSADAMRIFVLSSHYRSPLTYGEDSLDSAEKGAERLRQAARRPASGKPCRIDLAVYEKQFREAMDNDFNTPQALAALFDLARETNRACDEGQDSGEAQRLLGRLAGVLGLTLQEKKRDDLAAAPFIELLVSLRRELRQAKQWQLADTIRTGLAALNVTLEDTPTGTTWKSRRT